MTRDEVIKMAAECWLVCPTVRSDGVYADALVDFAELVAAAKTEECAKVCDEVAETGGDADECATEIDSQATAGLRTTAARQDARCAFLKANMNRLLFAAARGARIQVLGADKKWFTDSGVEFGTRLQQRIHPDDAHLQYGSISTALRARVLLDDPWADGFSLALNYACARWPEFQAIVHIDDDEYEMTILVLAEYLADDGL